MKFEILGDLREKWASLELGDEHRMCVEVPSQPTIPAGSIDGLVPSVDLYKIRVWPMTSDAPFDFHQFVTRVNERAGVLSAAVQRLESGQMF